MLKKISFIFIACLFVVLLLQLLEISNLNNAKDNLTSQIQLVMSLNIFAVGFVLIFIILSVNNLTSIGKKKKIGEIQNDVIITDSTSTPTVNSVTEQENRLTNLENILIHTLSRCNSAEEVCSKFLSATCSELKLAQGILFVRKKDSDEFYIKGTYAYYNENTGYSFRLGEGICGQVAKNQKAIILTNIPENYINIVSGLGLGSPRYLQAVPIIFAGEVIGVLELASFTNELLQTNDLETGVLKQLSNSLKGFL